MSGEASATETTSATDSASMSSGAAAETDVGSQSSVRSSGLQQQLAKLKDSNTKYKSLLKMARERIQAQEEELEELRKELERTKEELECRNGMGNGEAGGLGSFGDDGDEHVEGDDTIVSVVRVIRRLRLEDERPRRRKRRNGALVTEHSTDDEDDYQNEGMEEGGEDDDNEHDDDTNETIWALVEYEASDLTLDEKRQFQRWRKFSSEAQLSDHIRRDTGEPVELPPYSLSPLQSAMMEERAKLSVSKIEEEFRRFRVRAEVARKQADATVRALHNSNVQKTQRRIEGQDLESELEKARSEHAQLASLKAKMAEEEARWKQAYDNLVAENNVLKSSGAEALLAAQWRQRYETCLREKEDAEAQLKMEREKAEAIAEAQRREDAGKYELKYRDLKESFRLYRKKAKEIFEAQQAGDASVALLDMGNGAAQSADAKIAYLKNLMINYLTSDEAVREHMVTAIGTVLKFSPEDMSKVAAKKSEGEFGASWGLSFS